MIQGFYATQDTATPVRVAALALIANVVLCFSLVGPLKHGGLALATSLASYVNFVVLYAVFRRRLGGVNESRLGLSVGRSLAAAAVMGMACHWLATQLGLLGNPRFAVLAAGLALTIAVGVIIYLSLAWLLGSEELSEVYTLVTGRRLKEEGPDNR
jgi:putative peptidoglycan lipid II flippase